MKKKLQERYFGNGYEKYDKPANIGLLGQRTTIWAIKLEGTNNYRMLSAEEDELFDNLIKNVYGKLKGKQIKALKRLENDCC